MKANLRRAACSALIITLGLPLIQCGGGSPSEADDQPSEILDYREAKIFDDVSSTNRLLIDVTSRLTISQDGVSKRYLLLTNHPRESTFNPDVSAYPSVVDDAKGASFINAIYSLDDTTSIIARRYAAAETANPADMHECRTSDFSRLGRPTTLARGDLAPITSFGEVFLAASSTSMIVGTFEYTANNRQIRLDFPIKIINIDPRTRMYPGDPAYENWQAVSPLLPLYVGNGGSDCENVWPGYVAFRSFQGSQSAVHLCLTTIDGTLMNDYACTVEIPGVLRLYVIR